MNPNEKRARDAVKRDLTGIIFKHFEETKQSDEDMMHLLQKLDVRNLTTDQLIAVFYLTVGVDSE